MSFRFPMDINTAVPPIPPASTSSIPPRRHFLLWGFPLLLLALVWTNLALNPPWPVSTLFRRSGCLTFRLRCSSKATAARGSNLLVYIAISTSEHFPPNIRVFSKRACRNFQSARLLLGPLKSRYASRRGDTATAEAKMAGKSSGCPLSSTADRMIASCIWKPPVLATPSTDCPDLESRNNLAMGFASALAQTD